MAEGVMDNSSDNAELTRRGQAPQRHDAPVAAHGDRGKSRSPSASP